MADMRRRNSVKKTLRNTKIFREGPKEEAQNCIICLDKVSCRGKLSVCDHWFCFSCILEWSKNTNICPVCKTKFRCISKTHLVPGKSPIRKVRVPDIDQRTHLDDNEFIWAELESTSELEISDYEPSSHDDTADETYHVPPSLSMSLDTDNSETDENETLQPAHISLSEHMSFSDSTTSESEDDMVLTFTKKKTTKRKPFISDDDHDDDDSMFHNLDDEWLFNVNDIKRQGKSTQKNGFIIRRKPRRSSVQTFETLLRRRRQTLKTTSRTAKGKQRKHVSNFQNRKQTNSRETANSTARRAGGGSTTIGRWLSSTHSSQSTSSRGLSNTQDLITQHPERTTNRLRVAESSVRMGIPNVSRRHESRSTHSMLSQSKETPFMTSQSRSKQPVLPKKRNHKKLTFNFDNDPDSSSGESWMPPDQSKGMSKAPDYSRRTTNTKRSERMQPPERSRLFKELQNFFKD